MLVGCGWEVLDTLGAVRVEILLVSPPAPTVAPPTPTVTIRTPSSPPTYRPPKRGCVLPLIPPCLRLWVSIVCPSMIYYLIPYWCCCPPEKVLGWSIISSCSHPYIGAITQPLLWKTQHMDRRPEKLEILIIQGKYICIPQIWEEFPNSHCPSWVNQLW